MHRSRALIKADLVKACFLILCLFLATLASARSRKTDVSASNTQASRRAKAQPATDAKQTARRTAAASSRKHSSSKTVKGKRTTASAAPRGQQGISSDRARQIQTALIRERYLDGEPTGVMDQRTKDALTRYQGENGWQTKITPDSRALIKLGLGPQNDGLLNPDSAALASPHQLGQERMIPGGR